MSKKSTTQMTKSELISLTRDQHKRIEDLEHRVQELEEQLQVRAAAVILDQDTSHIVSVLRDRIRILEQQLGDRNELA
jgi:hypothetical protein